MCPISTIFWDKIGYWGLLSAGQYSIMAVRNHMTCFYLNWPTIKIFLHYLAFSCALGHILKSWKCIFQHIDQLKVTKENFWLIKTWISMKLIVVNDYQKRFHHKYLYNEGWFYTIFFLNISIVWSKSFRIILI